ncbi:hypothetical protein [Thermosulfurimonas sp. F29]|uniref:hypothetical protein n=1 Tax=Thermosulfurimonas sp. F29 TaxID=2867247 RepID=UPI001C831FFF|nr:hypothetical protein [Thermosulfurimonas sp. F29]MBX6423910.1 hypothetical protein [Thermosulfurimonas sp. F29]
MFSIPKKVVYDESGKPVEVILPWEVFQEIEEILGLDLDEEVREVLREARRDREAGNAEAYIPLEEI